MGSVGAPYVRRPVPFLSFKNVQEDPPRCCRKVEAAELAADIRQRTLPDYALYVPDVPHDGHDTRVSAADQWLAETLGPRLRDPASRRTACSL